MPARPRRREPNVYGPRPDGRWQVRVTVTDPRTGRRQRMERYARTLDEARIIRDKLISQSASGVQDASPERRTVAGWLDDWYAMHAPTLADYTRLSYRAAIDLHLAPALGDHRLTALKPLDVQRFVAAQTAAGAAPSSVRKRLAVLSTALNQAVDLELIPRNPARRVKRPADARTERPRLTADQARTLLTAAAGTWLEAFIAVGVGLGLRRGEALGLRWADIDWDGGWVHVRVQSTDAGGRIKVDQPLKTPGSAAALPLPPAIARILTAHRERQRRVIVGPLVFCRPDGQAMHHATVHRQYARLLRAAGVPHVGYHSCRRCCASVLVALGIDMPTVQRILRHSKASTTLGFYASTSEGQLRAAGETMGRALEG